MAQKLIGPDEPSGDYAAMAPYWVQVQTMLDGGEAMRAAGKKYLPQFPKEAKANYEYRRKNAKFTNIYRDIVENLASKPFAKPLTVKDGSLGTDLKDLVQNIDGAGNNLHVFASRTFFNGIAKSLDYIFVDHTKVPTGATVAVEKKMGARPYWIGMDAERVVAAYAEMIDGREEFVHVRILEPTTIRVGWEEKTMERVRVYDRAKLVGEPDADGVSTTTYGAPIWTLYEKRKKENTLSEFEWVPLETGVLRINIIPLVPFVTGRRKAGAWQFHPPMKDAADLQIEHYQQETNLKMAKELTCFPMLVGAGLTPRMDKDGKPEEVPVGPSAVLYAPPSRDGSAGDWHFIEPGASSLTFLAAEVDKTEQQLREQGRQPLTAQSGNLTTVTAGVAAAKGNSAVQAWAWGLKDTLERALEVTCLWLQDTTSKPEVNVYTDFGIEIGDGTSMDRLITMRSNGDLDQDTLWTEAQRRGELSADFDAKAAKVRLAEEAPQEPTDQDLLGALQPKRPPPQRPPPAKNDPPQRLAA